MIAALSLIAVFFFSYLTLVAAWLLVHFYRIASFRERRDTFCAMVVSVGYVVLNAAAFSRHGNCVSEWTVGWSILITLGLGWYVERSLERRMSWYQFCQQEEVKRAAVPPTS